MSLRTARVGHTRGSLPTCGRANSSGDLFASRLVWLQAAALEERDVSLDEIPPEERDRFLRLAASGGLR